MSLIVGTPTTVVASSPSTNPQTFQDLYMDLLNRVRASTNVNSTLEQAKRYINTSCHDMALGHDYKMPWLERQATLVTHAPYSDGTVGIAVGGTALVGTGTLWATDNNYGQDNMRSTGRVVIDGGANIYRISSVTDDTNAVLQDQYVASSAASGATYTYFEDEYALANDFLRPLDFQFFSVPMEIQLIPRNEFRRRIPRPNTPGRPKVATIVDAGFRDANTTPTKYVKFYPYPDGHYLIPYSYITKNIGVHFEGDEVNIMTEDDDEPLIPVRYRHLIVLGALTHWYRDKRDDARSQETQALYVDGVTRMLNDLDIASPTQARLQPNMDSYTRYAKRPYSPRGSRYLDMNNHFDYMRDRY